MTLDIFGVLAIFAGAILTAMGGAVGKILIDKLREGKQLRTIIEKLESKIDGLEKVIEAYRETLQIYGEVDAALLASNKALLEAAKGQCNGNVDAALARINEEKEKFDRYLQRRALDA